MTRCGNIHLKDISRVCLHSFSTWKAGSLAIKMSLYLLSQGRFIFLWKSPHGRFIFCFQGNKGGPDCPSFTGHSLRNVSSKWSILPPWYIFSQPAPSLNTTDILENYVTWQRNQQLLVLTSSGPPIRNTQHWPFGIYPILCLYSGSFLCIKQYFIPCIKLNIIAFKLIRTS